MTDGNLGRFLPDANLGEDTAAADGHSDLGNGQAVTYVF
jgi:hypothetical protein